jgi:hypothetical protein
MHTMTRAEIAAQNGSKKAAPEPQRAPSDADQVKVTMHDVADRLGKSALIMAASAEVIAKAVTRPPEKVLEAVIHRDENGRMSGVTITVKPKE